MALSVIRDEPALRSLHVWRLTVSRAVHALYHSFPAGRWVVRPGAEATIRIATAEVSYLASRVTVVYYYSTSNT